MLKQGQVEMVVAEWRPVYVVTTASGEVLRQPVDMEMEDIHSVGVDGDWASACGSNVATATDLRLLRAACGSNGVTATAYAC
jgi:hypothetical protein